MQRCLRLSFQPESIHNIIKTWMVHKSFFKADALREIAKEATRLDGKRQTRALKSGCTRVQILALLLPYLEHNTLPLRALLSLSEKWGN